MGLVYADIEIINSIDLGLVKRNLMDKDDVRSTRMNVLCDSGAYMMAINKTIKEQLNLEVVETRKAQMAKYKYLMW